MDLKLPDQAPPSEQAAFTLMFPVTTCLLSPCRPVSPAAAGCAAGWPWVEEEVPSQLPPRPPPRRSSACPTSSTWTACRSTGPRCGPSATHESGDTKMKRESLILDHL